MKTWNRSAVISARTKLFAVIGDPVAHSLSPVMQNWFIRQFGLDAVYTAFHVRNSDLRACVDGLRAMGIGGLNVTVPHKEAVLPFIDHASKAVELLGAANTLKNDDGRIRAFVTDPYGFEQSLVEKSRFKDAGVLMFGAGGAAKSVAYALARLGVKKLIIHDLVEDKTRELVKLCRERFGLADVSSLADVSVNLNDVIAETPILINATAVGMHPLHEKSVIEDFAPVSEKHFCFDLVYNPAKTRFLRLAERAGAAVQNGLDMLIFQGLQSLRIWTDEELQLTPGQLKHVRMIMNEQLGIHE